MTAESKMPSILVVDDEESVREAMNTALSDEGYEIVTSPNVPDALLKLLQMKFDVAILDVLMPDASGFELMNVMEKMCPETKIIILTAILDESSQFKDTAESSGVSAYLKKPCKLRDLKETIEKVLSQAETIA